MTCPSDLDDFVTLEDGRGDGDIADELPPLYNMFRW
jgi:hypothetical protein